VLFAVFIADNKILEINRKAAIIKKKRSRLYKFTAPRVFAFAFSIAKKFMNEYTLSKIQIHKTDPIKWQTAIFKIIPKDQLPTHFGGTLCDPDGNPKLTSRVTIYK